MTSDKSQLFINNSGTNHSPMKGSNELVSSTLIVETPVWPHIYLYNNLKDSELKEVAFYPNSTVDGV